MELYKKEKINPLAGCWPIAIQIPVFFSLYKVLFVTIEMRHAPFFGWIQDLSAPDPDHDLQPVRADPVDAAVHFLMIGIWPLLMGISMFVQMRLNPTPPDPTQKTDLHLDAADLHVHAGGFPAGLVIYWAWNNTLSVTQQYFIMRRQGVEVNLLGNILESLGLKKAGRRRPERRQGAGTDKPKSSADAGEAADADGPAARPKKSAGEGDRRPRRRARPRPAASAPKARSRASRDQAPQPAEAEG